MLKKKTTIIPTTARITKSTVSFPKEVHELPRILSEYYLEPEYLLDIIDTIEYEIDKPPDKRKKEYKIWKDTLQKLSVKCNKLMGYKCYNFKF